MYDTNFVYGVRDNFYIDDTDEANEAAHGYGSNTPSDEAYGDMMEEEHSAQGKIDYAAYKNICSRRRSK